ncbi:hypothetical protein E2C01_006990 [Portunus trituberculatus]|uniref:Uncharacterized protein n=1 Tax=Portunus trituberculatus TaxID=210409 RepID=A0A5B7CXR2_PORTR|nr:hypothetical protein [Portunus trituberculatus]
MVTSKNMFKNTYKRNLRLCTKPFRLNKSCTEPSPQHTNTPTTPSSNASPILLPVMPQDIQHLLYKSGPPGSLLSLMSGKV